MVIIRSELTVLEQTLSDVIATGKGTTIFVTGEPGIGKSTFVQEFLNQCDDRLDLNILTATGRCIDIDGISHGYLPWKEVLIELDADRAAGRDLEKKQNFKAIIKAIIDESGSQWIQSIPQIGDISSAILETAHAIKHIEEIDVSTGETRDLSFRERLAHVVKECTGAWMGAIPVVGGLAEAVYATSRSLSEKRRDIQMRNQEDFFILVMRRLRTLAADNPVVVFLDDLQWADASSLSLLLYLAKNLQDMPYPLFLLASYRSEDIRQGRRDPDTGAIERHPLEEKLNVLNRYGACREIALSKFDVHQIDGYINHRFAKHQFDQAFFRELLEITEGNALFVQEMLTNIVEHGFIAERDGVWRVVSTIDYSLLPATVEGVIRERYERLGEELQELLQVAAVEGVEFALGVVETILQETRFKIDRKVDSLIHKHDLVRRSSKSHPQLARIYEFTHNLVQKYIYHAMDDGFRRGVHQMIAETMKGMFDEERMTLWRAQYAFHLGVGYGIIDENRHVLLDNSTASGAERLGEFLQLEMDLAEQYIAVYNNEEAIRSCTEVMELAELNGDSDTMVRFLFCKGAVLSQTGAWDAAVSLFEEVVALGEARQRKDWQMEGHLKLSALCRQHGKYDQTEKYIETTLRLAEELGNRAATAEAIMERGTMHWMRGEYDRAMECFEHCLAIRQDLGEQGLLAYTVASMGIVHVYRQEYDRALGCFQQQKAIGQERRDRRVIALADGNIGNVYYSRGEYDRALECYALQQVIYREISDPQLLANAIGNTGNVYMSRGDYDRALECFFQQDATYRELGDLRGMSYAAGYIGNLFACRGEYDRAMERFRQKESLCRDLGDRKELAFAIGYRGWVHRLRGEFDLALECYRQQAEGCHELGDRDGRAYAVGFLGQTLMDSGAYEQALESLDDALRSHRELGVAAGMVNWLSARAWVLLELLDTEPQMSVYLPRHVPGASPDTWTVLSLQHIRNNVEECIAISQQLQKPDTLFEGRVLMARVHARDGRHELAMQQLETLLSSPDNDEQRAELQYWIWRLGGSAECRSQACRLYEELFEGTPNHGYRRRIDELTAATQSTQG